MTDDAGCLRVKQQVEARRGEAHASFQGSTITED